jgi:hypothetical protein
VVRGKKESWRFRPSAGATAQHRKGRALAALREYSGFDSALYRTLEAKWHFSQDNATSHDLQMATFESKPL